MFSPIARRGEGGGKGTGVEGSSRFQNFPRSAGFFFPVKVVKGIKKGNLCDVWVLCLDWKGRVLASWVLGGNLRKV